MALVCRGHLFLFFVDFPPAYDRATVRFTFSTFLIQGTDNNLEIFKICTEEEINKQMKKKKKKLRKKQGYGFLCLSF